MEHSQNVYGLFVCLFVCCVQVCVYRCHEVRGNEAMFRSKMKWVEQGEKSTKYFYNLEKTNYEKKLIREVKLQNEEIISNPSQVNKEIEAFYRKMNTAKINDNMDNHAYEHKFNDLIEDLKFLNSAVKNKAS